MLRPCENTTAVIAKQLSDALNRLPASLLEIKPAVIIYHFDSTKLAADHGYSSQGLRKPVNDLSRGASIDDIIYTIALTAIQAQQLTIEAY